MSSIEELLAVVPQPPDFKIEWQVIENDMMRFYAAAMKETQQNPLHHAEGNVWNHTKMVCESIVSDIDFQKLSERQRQELFLAALFHDIGKITTTKLDDGEWVSPNHSIVGANIVREILWREYGICGTNELQNFRETVCLLVRYHMIPPYVLDSEKPESRLIRIAANGELASDFTLKLLMILSKADTSGRIAQDVVKGIENVNFCAELSKEIGCFNQPIDFYSDYTEFAYLSGKNVTPHTELYNDTKCEVILLCGLPGTGKDTWIKQNYPDYPVISLDDIRMEFGISPVGNQQEVVRIAHTRAKELLRQQKSFVWNATSITPDIRAKHISLFCSYKAFVKIVFLETEWGTNLSRNKNRKDSVPQSVIEKMLAKFIPPERFEAHSVKWICI